MASKTVEGVGAEIREKTQEMSTQIRDTAQELSTQAQETVSEYYEQGRDSLRELNQTIEAQVRDRPLQSLLVAGGIGLVLALLLRRS